MKDGKITISEAIKSIRDDSSFRIVGDQIDLDTAIIEWMDGTTPISNSDIQTEQDQLQAEYDVLAWTRNRVNEYPDTGAQFNKIYDDGLTKWKSEMVDPVKTKWPKDNSGPV